MIQIEVPQRSTSDEVFLGPNLFYRIGFWIMKSISFTWRNIKSILTDCNFVTSVFDGNFHTSGTSMTSPNNFVDDFTEKLDRFTFKNKPTNFVDDYKSRVANLHSSMHFPHWVRCISKVLRYYFETVPHFEKCMFKCGEYKPVFTNLHRFKNIN